MQNGYSRKDNQSPPHHRWLARSLQKCPPNLRPRHNRTRHRHKQLTGRECPRAPGRCCSRLPCPVLGAERSNWPCNACLSVLRQMALQKTPPGHMYFSQFGVTAKQNPGRPKHWSRVWNWNGGGGSQQVTGPHLDKPPLKTERTLQVHCRARLRLYLFEGRRRSSLSLGRWSSSTRPPPRSKTLVKYGFIILGALRNLQTFYLFWRYLF